MLEIIKYPNEILRTPTPKVEKYNAPIKFLAQNMLETLANPDINGYGLAAPQVGESLRMFVIKTTEEDHVFINPEIIETEGIQKEYEGCLSIPNVYERVTRYKRVVVEAYNQEGHKFKIDTKNNLLFARGIQHELDHLNGILLIDHLEKDKKSKIIKKLNKAQKNPKPKRSGKVKKK